MTVAKDSIPLFFHFVKREEKEREKLGAKMLARLGSPDKICHKSLFLAKSKEKFRFFLKKHLTKYTD